MSIPNVKITFANGAIGSVAESADGVTGLIVPGSAVAGKLETGKAYVMYTPDSLAGLGVTSREGDANAYLYRCVQQFYAEAGRGAELWVMVAGAGALVSAMLDEEGVYSKKLLKVANGRIRTLVAASGAAAGALENGLEGDVMESIRKGQALGEWAATELYAPVTVLIEGRGYRAGAATELPDLGEYAFNRVGVVVGELGDGGSVAVLVAGRAARIPVQRHVGRVQDGALSVSSASIGGVEAGEADIETLNTRGYMTLRTIVGKSGYYVCDDHLATSLSDDYHSFARRRVVDKAYRIAYEVLVEKLSDEVPVTSQGCIVATMAKSWEGDVIAAIAKQMTSEGELSRDPDDSRDQGVTCEVDTTQNVVSSGKVGVAVRVKPYGYAKYINVSLGFSAVSD